ncbi:site-specific integrase, partial [Winogradskyella sp.]|uniref:site-specific integrase n=1 Tax=Winogradskyella sp. TaxID=1883156 RepID=UPI0025D4FB94
KYNNLTKLYRYVNKEVINENKVPSQLQHTSITSKSTKKELISTKTSISKSDTNTANKNPEDIPFIKAFDIALNLKEKAVSSNTIKDYRRKVKLFVAWMKKTHPTKKNIREIYRKDLLDYFNEILLKTSARNRNNYRTELASIFQVLKNNELIDENYIHTIGSG